MKIVAVLVLLFGLAPGAAAAQSRPIPAVHHQVSANAAAQAAFDQGLLDYYAYNPEAAEHEFYTASDLDSHLAMAYWGIAISNAPNLNVPPNDSRDDQARQAIERAEDLANYASPEDRALINAAAARYVSSSSAKPDALQRVYSDRLGRIAAAYPNDSTAANLYAEASLYVAVDEGAASSPGKMTHAQQQMAFQKSVARVLPLFERDLKGFPDDIALMHFYIHAAQMAGRSSLALDAATKLATYDFPPQDSHLAHMPGHIFLDLGMYAQGTAVAQRSVALDEAEIACCHPGYYSATRYYRKHNVSFLLYALTESGDTAQAIAAAKRFGDAEFLARQYVAAGEWKNALAVAPPRRSGKAFSFLRGIAYAELGDFIHARRELAQIPAVNSNSSPDNATQDAMRLLLAARLDESQHRNAQALTALKLASRLANSAFKFTGAEMPELYFYSPNIQLARLASNLGNKAAARSALHAELSVSPKSPAALAMLSQLDAR